jgi:hypothetical protein
MLQGPLIQFVIDLICSRIDSTEAIKRPREQCNADSDVQAQVSNLLMWTTLIGSVIGNCQNFTVVQCTRVVVLTFDIITSMAGLLSTAIYSKMSDKRGRRPVFIINGLVCVTKKRHRVQRALLTPSFNLI